MAARPQRLVPLTDSALSELRESRGPAMLATRAPDALKRLRHPGLLPEDDFEWFIERERSLADRGSRQFSLLVVRFVEPTADELEQLAAIVMERLRTTDLIGRLKGGALGMLLADTLPDGAMVVAASVDNAVTKLGLRVESSIYVYPTVDDDRPAPPGPRGGAASGNGNGSASGNGHADGNGHSDGNGKAGGNGHAGGPAPADVPARAPWPMHDLWTRMSVPLPLWKRTVDVVLSGLALVLLLPVFAVVAIAIRLDSPGSVFFKQKRVGRAAMPFKLYKFRSMVQDAERMQPELRPLNEQSGPVFKIRRDPRVTRVGKWLRRWSIDELPQLWNVLKGDISLVGPRSPTFEEVSEYERWQRRRLDIQGGITCIWQVSGRSEVGFREWMRMDMAYVSRRSFWLDLKLLVRTLVAVLTGRGAY